MEHATTSPGKLPGGSEKPSKDAQEGSEDLERGFVEANGLRFGYLAAGPAEGEVVLCFHGFPDSAWSWRFLLPALARAGYRAVAPFMRGYAPTDVPADGVYQTGALVRDACALHDELSPGRPAVIVGHDWGAFAAYGAVALEPQRWRAVVTGAVPPITAMAEAFFSFDQLKRSWYMFFFQSPLAETVVSMDDLAFIDRLWRDWSPGYDASADTARVKESLRAPANLSAAIGYYRAMFDPAGQVAELAAEQAATMMPSPLPLLYMHGTDDGCLAFSLAKAAEAHLPSGSRMLPVEGAGHFFQVEKPDLVAEAVIDFIGEPRR